jgi:hypothetical protein
LLDRGAITDQALNEKVAEIRARQEAEGLR